MALTPATLDGAKAELERTRTQRNDGRLPRTGYRPRLDDFARAYLSAPTPAQKKLSTQGIERQAIRRWIAHLGGVRIDKITAPMIHSYREKRLAMDRTARTVNPDVIALRNVLNAANSSRVRSGRRSEGFCLSCRTSGNIWKQAAVLPAGAGETAFFGRSD